MHYLSQNKKIAISAVAIFLMSLSSMVFFLENNVDQNPGHGQANIFESEHEQEGEVVSPEAVYRKGLGDLENPIFSIDTNSHIDFVSDDFCQRLSKKCEYILGTSFYDYLNIKDLPDFVAAHTKLIQEPKLTEGIGPFRMMTSEGEMLVLLKAFPLLEENDKVFKIVFSIKDITSQAEELNNSGKEINDEVEDMETEMDDSWIKTLYPKIKDVKEEQDMRMVVDKISFKTSE